ncbi:MAG: hypothetical protein HY040_28100 [Planctomycetes bacterium]|nr:hypothetical protein [Planctomycetota bacterium]
MHNLSVAPTSLVLFAFDRFWPNLQGLMHWAPNLRNVFILPTEATGDAARRLHAFCNECLRTQHPELSVHSLDKPPQGVRSQVDALRSGFPGENWLLLGTSDDAPSFAEMFPFVGQTDVQVVSRDRHSGWLHLISDSAGVRTESIAIPADATDAIPVNVLLKHFWRDEFAQIEAGYSVDALELSRTALHHRGDWERVAQDTGAALELPFEAFVAQALREMGVTNLAVVGGKPAPDASGERETLILANRGGLRIVDCNLNRLEGLASHLRRLAGGLEARILFLWPTRAFPDEFRGLLDAYHMDLLERKDLGRFFHRLAEFVGVDALPASLLEADKIMDDVAAKGLRFFPARRPRVPVKPPKPPRIRPPRPPRTQIAPRTPAPAPIAQSNPQPMVVPSAPPESREPAYDQPVQVRILGPFHLGNLRGYDVQEEGWPVGVLAWGNPPSQKPRFGDVVTVFRENLDPKNPRYRWDRKP